MAQWYFSYDGNQIGPLDDAAARAQAQQRPDGFAWREGFPEWMPIGRIAELAGAGAGSAAATPPPTTFRTSDEIDFEIFGEEMQFVEIELDPGESVVAEAGAMMYKDPAIQMNTVFGDASKQHEQASFLGKLVGAGKRLLTGESLFMTVFTHQGQGKARIAFSSPYPGSIIPVTLPNYGGTLICQKDAFLCAARGVSIGIFFQRKILTGLFGGEGFIMQKLEGDGLAFVHAGGTIVERQLKEGELMHADTGCVVAFTSGIDFDIQQVGGIKSALFGGEGLFFASLRGPGHVWLQSLPFSRLAGRMLQAAPQKGGHRGEGSILGGLGNLLDGDNQW
ncbi:MAG: TIGR00266 family protein [Acidobacteriota bacterium]|nr:MAG: TIGR00266 family protein [Acidobacteriota bacterium]